MDPTTFNPLDHCTALYWAPDGSLVILGCLDPTEDDLRAWAAAFPDQIPPLPGALDDLRNQYCNQIENAKDSIMRAGFSYLGDQMQADPEARANLSDWVLFDLKGILVYPCYWRRSDNTFLVLNSEDDLLGLAGAMNSFTTQTYADIFTAKDSIRQAPDLATIQQIYADWAAKAGVS